MKKIIRTFIVVSFFIFTSCKDVIITEFDSFKWHRLEIISQNDSVYYNELLDDSFLEFNENNTGFINYGYETKDFSWKKIGDYISINQILKFEQTSQRIELPLNNINKNIPLGVNLILKEGLGSSTTNKNRDNFINTSWKWTKYFDAQNGYYPNELITVIKEKINLKDILINISNYEAEFIFRRNDLNIDTHLFDGRDSLKTFWKEKNNILNFLDKKVSSDYFFVNLIFKDDKLLLPMEDSEKNLYYFIFEPTKNYK